jgi:2-octaprenyl-6-methoxyphenol hydroxylase
LWTSGPFLLEHRDENFFGEFLGKIEVESKISGFPLKAYETDKYVNKRIVLVADTAHVIHPLAGQGLNQGIKDISCLSELLSRLGISESMLNQYQSLRKTDNSNMLEITDMMNSVFSSNSKFLQIGRLLGFYTIEKFSSLKKIRTKFKFLQM